MNRNIKRIISIMLTVSAFSTIAPATDMNLMTTKVYAATDTGVTSLKVKTSGGTTLRTYDDNDYESKNQVKDDQLEAGKTYYAKTSSKSIKINVSGVNEDNIRVFKGTSSSTKGARAGSSISLPSDAATIVVRVYSEAPGSVKYNNKTNMIDEYRIKVKYTGNSNDDDDNDDNVYLKSISLSSGTIDFSKKTSTYDINVDEDINEVTIAAKPDCDSDEYDKYKVRIDGTKVDKDDKFKEKISLNKGKNEIKVTVEDDDDNTREYNLKITRGKISATNTSATTNNATSNVTNNTIAVKSSQWVKTNGMWQYNDATGNILKNSWVQNYYVQADGNMVTGWESINGSWYFFDSQGLMQTGWIKDLDGKYYYLNSNGSMAYNTTVGGYKLGANGAWGK